MEKVVQHTDEQKRMYAIYSMYGAVFGKNSYYRQCELETEFSKQNPKPSREVRKQVVTNLGNTIEIILHPSSPLSNQVSGYTFDKNEGVFVVVKGSKRPKITRETFIWDTQYWYKTDGKLATAAHQLLMTEWNEKKDLFVLDRLFEELLQKLPDAEDYIAMTPENAEEKLKEKGWTVPSGLNFSRFCPGSWLDHPETGYRCSAGVDNEMKFDTKTIKQFGWSSDD